MSVFFDGGAAGGDESVVMTGAQFKAENPLDPITAATLVIADGDQVRVSRLVHSSEFRSSQPPTVAIQGDLDGGTVHVLTRPFDTWTWMYDVRDSFDGTNVADGQENVRQSYSSTGFMLAVLVGAANAAGAQFKMAIV